MICPFIYGRLAGRVCIDPNCTTSSSHKDHQMSDVPLIRFIDGTEPYIEALSWTCCSYSTQRYTLFHCKFLPEYLTNARQSNMTITITQSLCCFIENKPGYTNICKLHFSDFVEIRVSGKEVFVMVCHVNDEVT